MFLCFQKTSGENISCLSNCWVAAHTQYLPGRVEPEGNIGFTATTYYYFRHEIFVNVITHHMYHVEKDCLHSRLAQMCTAPCSSWWLSMGSCLVTAIWISGSLHIFISQCVFTLQSGCCSIHCPHMLPVFTVAEVVTRYSPTFYWPKPLQPPSFQCFKHSHIFWSPEQPNWMMETGPS